MYPRNKTGPLRRVNCTPWNIFPPPYLEDQYLLCDGQGSLEFDQALAEASRNLTSTCDCPEDCQSLDFHSSVQSQEIDPRSACGPGGIVLARTRTVG